jgi:hypothetical protein
MASTEKTPSFFNCAPPNEIAGRVCHRNATAGPVVLRKTCDRDGVALCTAVTVARLCDVCVGQGFAASRARAVLTLNKSSLSTITPQSQWNANAILSQLNSHDYVALVLKNFTNAWIVAETAFVR